MTANEIVQELNDIGPTLHYVEPSPPKGKIQIKGRWVGHRVSIDDLNEALAYEYPPTPELSPLRYEKEVLGTRGLLGLLVPGF